MAFEYGAGIEREVMLWRNLLNIKMWGMVASLISIFVVVVVVVDAEHSVAMLS